MMSAMTLGATLYMPCTRHDLFERLFGPTAVPGLRSAVLCLEDAVLDHDISAAMVHLAALLRRIAQRDAAPGDPMIFIRPRHGTMLEHILHLPGIERVQGFVLPKAHADNMPAYL